MTGFVAGTLVHTEKGLVPIQNIKIGDRVLSKLDDKLVYKIVENLKESTDKKEIYLLMKQYY